VATAYGSKGRYKHVVHERNIREMDNWRWTEMERRGSHSGSTSRGITHSYCSCRAWSLILSTLARNSTVHSTSRDFLDVPARRRMDSRRRCRAKRSRSPGRSVLIASSRPAPPYLNVSSTHKHRGQKISTQSIREVEYVDDSPSHEDSQSRLLINIPLVLAAVEQAADRNHRTRSQFRPPA
jgi:hypothetical protein